MSRDAWPPSRVEWSTLVAILLLATILRAGWPTLTEFKFSEARLEALALELTREGRVPLVGVPSSAGFDHSPISVYLYAPAFLLTANPIPATIYGGLVGVAAVALAWWLARRWPGGSRWSAVAAAVLFAASPWSVAFSRKIWQVAFVPLLVLVFVALVVSTLVEKRRWRLMWAIVILALLIQVHPSAISLAPALFLWLILFWREVKLGPLLVGGLLSLLTAVPFLIHQAHNGWPALTALSSLPEATWDLTSIRLAWEAITGRGIHALAGDAYPLLSIVPQLGWFFNLVGWLVVASALGLAWRMATSWNAADPRSRRTARIDLILLSSLAIPVLFNLRYSLPLHLHFFALILPAAYLVAGRGAGALFAAAKSRPLRVAALAVLGLLAAAQVMGLGLMARFVATHDTPGGFGTPLRSYMAVADEAVATADKVGAAEILVVGQGNSIIVDERPAIFDALLRERVDYRFVDGQAAAVFPPHRALALLAPDAGEATRWYEPWPSQQTGSGYRLVSLDGSWPQGGLLTIAGPRTFQNGVEVQNYRWTGGQKTEVLGRFCLLWQVLWIDPGDTHFYVQVFDGQGEMLGQQDAVGYPVAERRRGDRIVSEFDITQRSNQPGEPQWGRVGLYRYPEIVSVPVIDEAGNPVSDVVQVGPLGQEQ